MLLRRSRGTHQVREMPVWERGKGSVLRTGDVGFVLLSACSCAGMTAWKLWSLTSMAAMSP